MSDVDISHQEAGATVSDAPIDVDILPSDAEASTSAAGPSRQAGPGRPKGKITTTATSNTGKDAELGIDSFLLPKSTGRMSIQTHEKPNTTWLIDFMIAVTKIAKSAVRVLKC